LCKTKEKKYRYMKREHHMMMETEAASQAMLRTDRKVPEARRRQGKIFSYSSEQAWSALTFTLDFNLQNCEAIKFFCFKSPTL
jgi:hypothetical protein